VLVLVLVTVPVMVLELVQAPPGHTPPNQQRAPVTAQWQ
jgi:hypothetical protein